MLERLSPHFVIMQREAPSPQGLAKLRADRDVDPQVAELYEEIGRVDIKGDGPRYFRFWPPERALEIDATYAVSENLPGSIPIGSDGGGNLIIVRDGRVFAVGYSVLDEDEMTPLGNTLAAFLENPEPLFAWVEE